MHEQCEKCRDRATEAWLNAGAPKAHACTLNYPQVHLDEYDRCFDSPVVKYVKYLHAHGVFVANMFVGGWEPGQMVVQLPFDGVEHWCFAMKKNRWDALVSPMGAMFKVYASDFPEDAM